jgi:hypothetical protein
MSVLDRPDNVPVPLGYCPCEGTPHPDGDIVYLYPELSAPAGMAVRGLMVEGASGIGAETFQERLGELWLKVAVASWTFLDDDGSPIPLTPENIVRALPYGKGGRLVADKADDLYADSVVAPLVKQLETLSKPGRTPSSPRATSASRNGTAKRRSRSSTATTAKARRSG